MTSRGGTIESAPMPSTLRCLAEIQGPAARVTLRGRLDAETLWSFGAELSTLIRAGRQHLTVDLGELDDVSAVCVGVVNRIVGELRPTGGTLRLTGADDDLIRLLRAAGMHPSVITDDPHNSSGRATAS
jgi:anti-anti-sigma factor